MLELTKEECLELEERVAQKVHSSFPDSCDDNTQKLYEVICRMASRATITTIREYEKMQVEKQNLQQENCTSDS